MKPYVWNPDLTPSEEADGAYWERNMLAAMLAVTMNENYMNAFGKIPFGKESGWYEDTDNNWEGWKRVISIDGGRYTFHIPDDFNVGSLPQIAPNWDGHTTDEKWTRAMQEYLNIEPTKED